MRSGADSLEHLFPPIWTRGGRHGGELRVFESQLSGGLTAVHVVHKEEGVRDVRMVDTGRRGGTLWWLTSGGKIEG